MKELKVGCIVLGRLENNCYFIHNEGEYDAIVIDPSTQGEVVATKLREKGLTIKGILLTHGHFDHIMGVEGMRKITDAPIYAGVKEEEILKNPALNHSANINKDCRVYPEVFVKENDVINISGMEFKVIETPGHTEGSVSFYFEAQKVLFSGDTLFFENVGRTDFETSNPSDMPRSLEKLMKLLDDVTVYPGHGDFTTIGHERAYNPYCCNI